MKTIRVGIFETNSSSTHSITLCSEEDYEKWKNGELIYDRYSDSLIPLNEMEEDPDRYQYLKYDEFENEINYPQFYEEYETKSGEKVIAFGYYGCEG